MDAGRPRDEPVHDITEHGFLGPLPFELLDPRWVNARMPVTCGDRGLLLTRGVTLVGTCAVVADGLLGGGGPWRGPASRFM